MFCALRNPLPQPLCSGEVVRFRLSYSITILYYTTLYYTILYDTILHYTIL